MTAKKGKSFLALLSDYGLTFVLTMLLFISIALPIYQNAPLIKESKTNMERETSSLKEVVSTTGLQDYNILNQKLTSLDEMASNYIYRLAKTSFFLNGKTSFPKKDGNEVIKEEDTFLFKREEYYADPLSKYFLKFKEGEESLKSYKYLDKDYSLNKEDYLYLKAFGYEEDIYADYFVSLDAQLPKYLQLSFSKATLLADYFAYEEKEGTSVFFTLKKAFLRAEKVFINEVETLYTPYLKHQAIFEENYQVVVGFYFLALFITFIVSYLLLFLLFPIFSKGHVSLGFYLHKLNYSSNEETLPKCYQYFFAYFFRFFEFISSSCFILIFLSQTGLLFYSFNSFELFYIYIFSFLLLFSSLLSLLFSKENLPLEEKLTGLLIKDLNEWEKAKSVEEIKNNGDK